MQLQGQRVKVSKEVAVGDQLVIRQGWDEKEVVVLGLSERRGPASEAQQLYQESAQSVARREHEAQLRRAAGGNRMNHRPDKYERRQLQRLHRDRHSPSAED